MTLTVGLSGPQHRTSMRMWACRAAALTCAAISLTGAVAGFTVMVQADRLPEGQGSHRSLVGLSVGLGGLVGLTVSLISTAAAFGGRAASLADDAGGSASVASMAVFSSAIAPSYGVATGIFV